jgi:adenylylsulfate kinase-like enzyme
MMPIGYESGKMADRELPFVVVVTGPPASGKTTVAERLQAVLEVPLLTKDAIKERLFDELGWSDREWSNTLGRTSILLLHDLVERLVAGRVSHIVEANFEAISAPRFAALDAGLVQVYCSAPAEVLIRRFEERPRHPGHVDDAWNLADELEKGRWPRLELDAPRVEYETEVGEPDEVVERVLSLR